MVRIKVNQEICIGCGSCVAICPKGFKMVDGKAKAIKSEVKAISCEKDAAESCPVGAITVED